MATAPPPTAGARSAQEWKDVLAEILPPQGRWSEDAYLVLTDHRNRLVELTDGFLEILPVPTDRHQSLLKFLFLAFFGFAEPRGGKVHFAPLRLQIRPDKFREPDLLLLLSANDPRRQNRFWLGADLALEVVSEEKPERDLVVFCFSRKWRDAPPELYYDSAGVSPCGSLGRTIRLSRRWPSFDAI